MCAHRAFLLTLIVAAYVMVSPAWASEQRGTVVSGGYPVPGATVTAVQGERHVTTTTDASGAYRFADLADGVWILHVEMPLFESVDRAVTVGTKPEPVLLELHLLPLDRMLAAAQQRALGATAEASTPASTKAVPKKNRSEADDAPLPKPQDDSAAPDGLLVNGSSNNAGMSPFAMAQAFGNQRSGSRALFTGNLGIHVGNAALDARPYSLTGLDTPKPSYSLVTAVAALAGPIRIPHLLPRGGPNFNVIYTWTRNSTAQTLAGLVPTAAQRASTGIAVSPVAQSLLNLYPLPNLAGNSNYNYQVPVVNPTHGDDLQLRLSGGLAHVGNLSGSVSLQSTRAGNLSLFRFLDTTDTLGVNATLGWQRRLRNGLFGTLGVQYSRSRMEVLPQFGNRENISGEAGMTGNLQDARDWGPPTLTFASGIATLTDTQSAYNRNQTVGFSYGVQWYRAHHNITAGGDFRRQEFNYLQQTDARGTFTFTGASFGNDFTDFLRGVPDTASIAYGNADKYLRQSVYDLYVADDWRLRPELTLNVGLRWEYGAPIDELKDRLVNLDVANGFTAVAQVLASDPQGSLTGQQYPRSLLRPDRDIVEPRLGLAWRPLLGSSVVVRAGYGLYADSSVYQRTALLLAQQAPLSRTVTANNADCAQSLATGPNPCGSITANTFAVDPNFRVGYAQVWQLSVQRDLPFALQASATYSGVKGSNGVQQFLPNTYAPGASNPCPSCPVGFLYQTSNGTSIRHAGILQLRRRLRSGFTATVFYTYSKSIDDDALLGGQGPQAAGSASATSGTSTIAQNWRNLQVERSRSSFDQRHLINLSLQYTTGMGIGGGTLLSGWRGHLYKEWTLSAVMAAGTGKPLTPVYLEALNGTGYTGLVRPDVTGVSVYSTAPGRYRNPAAYTAPQPGQFGDAGRYSITGPSQLALDASLARTFRLSKRYNLDVRADASNVLNRVVFSAYNTTIDPALVSPTFGLPTSANPMRSVQLTARLRF